jgi:RNA polymerase sigma-70 factor (ECF subfamily)
MAEVGDVLPLDHPAPGGGDDSAVAEFFSGKAQAAKPTLVDGVMNVAVVPSGRLLVVLRLEIAAGRIAAIEAVADPSDMAEFDLTIMEER